MKQIRLFLSTYAKLLLGGFVIVTVSYILLFRGLSSLVPDYSATELATHQQSQSLRTIYENPINAPYKALVWLAGKTGHHSILVTRVAAALCASACVVLLYWILTHWYSKRIAMVATLLFATSSSFLHLGRYGSGLVLQLATIVLVACALLIRRFPTKQWLPYVVVPLCISLLYIPSFIWFELLGLLLIRTDLVRAYRTQKKLHVWLLLALGLVVLAPLLWVSGHSLAIARMALGLPETLPTFSVLGNNALHLASSIGFRGYWPADIWLYGAPLLNAVEVVLFVLGLYLLIRKPHNRASVFVLGGLVLSTLIIVIGSAPYATLVPFLYLTIAGGVYYLLDQWLSVFPRNPVARMVGVGLVGVVACFSVLYHIHAYFTAWPKAPETRQTFVVKQPS